MSTFISIGLHVSLIILAYYGLPSFKVKEPIELPIDIVEEMIKVKSAEKDQTLQEKKGFFLNEFAYHPVSKEKIPIWVANFVLSDYGSGALMGVPGHDQRDFEFATKYSLPIIKVISSENEDSDKASTDKGKLINSDQFDGLSFDDAFIKIQKFAEQNNFGRFEENYRLRNWGVSRQRSWGAPIPMMISENEDDNDAIPFSDLSDDELKAESIAVSYTHLTLPTKRIV